MKKLHVVIFTDLDGTLLNHDYTYAQALPALRLLDNLNIPLILTSSKTRSEIASLRTELKNRHPFIVENGGAAYYPSGYFTNQPSDKLSCVNFGIPYAEVVKIINKLRREMDIKLAGFSDWSAEEVAKKTGLSISDSVRAKQRDCGEPVLWSDTEENLERFREGLAGFDLCLVKGGRFYHVAGVHDKATAVQWMMTEFKKNHSGARIVSAALGDAENDLKMLKTVDYAMVIPQSSKYKLELHDAKSVYYSNDTGAAGWCEAIEYFLYKILARE